MEKRIPFGDVGKSVAGLFGTLLLLGFFIYLAFEKVLAPGVRGTGDVIWDFWSVTGTAGAAFCIFVVYFYPTIIAHDVSSRIKEIEAIRESEGLYKDTVISHKYFWIIFIVNLIFSFSGVAWLALFFWAHAPGTVIIPDLIATKIKEKNQPDLELKPEPDLEIKPEPDLESKLQEVKNLAEKGLLTEDEASIRRNKIITDE